MKNNSHTLTKGSVGKGILLFTLPLLGSSLIQQLYSTVDLIFVGQLLGTKASAAIGAMRRFIWSRVRLGRGSFA